MPHKNLIICAAGDKSVHRTWLSDVRRRTFDLCLIYFGNQPGRFASEADHYFVRQGVKYQLLSALTQKQPKLFQRYELLWFPDDDVAADTHSVNQLFQLMKQYGLQVAQPAISQGDATYRALRRHPEYLLRFAGFVEVMSPAFTQDAFQQVLPTFDENLSAWGIDLLWANMFRPNEVAVIDAVGVHHTRPLQSGGVHKLFAARGIDPQADYDALVKKYGLASRRSQRSLYFDSARLRGIDLAGRRVWTRPWWTSIWPGERRLRARLRAA